MKYYFLKSPILFLLLTLYTSVIWGQQSDIDVNIFNDYNHAVKLFNNKAYAAAQKNFVDVSKKLKDNTNLRAEADYYDAMCAIKLNQTDADKKVLGFVEKYPNSTKKDKAFFLVGNYYFANKRASYALKWFTKVNREALSEENKKELDFKMGYALLTTQNLKRARGHFLKLINDPKYGNDSRYYYGYIAYKQEDYEEAETTLSELADQEAYKSEVTYYLLDISFKAGKFERCIEVGLKLLEKAKPKERSEIAKIVGESYFNLKEYEKSISYLEEYRGKKGKWSNTDYYQLGFAYYKQNDFEKAVSNFNRIIDEQNNVSQNAYYNLGECYMYLEKKTEALNAFKNASEMDFNPKVKEDAALNYAKLSYEEGNPYKSVALVLQDFLKAYPKSPSYEEINGLVVTSYLYQQDYVGALDYLAKNKSAQNKELTYEVSYYRGVQLFMDRKLKEAIPFFIAGIKCTDPIVKSKSQYWKAEANYQLGNFQNALDDFIAFKKISGSKDVEEYAQVDYNIGYSYFKLKEYPNAVVAFQRFIATENDDVVMNDDAIIRKGDSEYATKNYRKAIASYKKVIDAYGSGADYAQYQSAMSYGFLKDNTKKVAQLLKLIKDFETSGLRDDAYFQLGNTYAIDKDNENAHLSYEKLTSEFPRSSFNANVLLRNGLLYFNDNENEKALTIFKQIVAKYPNSPEAKQAVTNARNVHVELGTVDEYATWVRTVKFMDVTDTELDNTMFESAENKFLANKTKGAISGFQKYITNFPEGLHALKSNFYLAQLLVKEGRNDEAIPNYQYVVDQDQSEFSEEALNKLSQILLEKEDWTNAIPLLARLETEANFPQNVIYAQSNLMKGYYQSDDYKNAVAYAEKVLQNSKIDANVEYDAKIIIARSAYKTDDYVTAEEFYKEVERNASGELKAEALYFSAFFKNYNKKYAESNKVVQKVISDYSAYKYWGAKSFIIMAKNYYAIEKSDPYQATFILENIIKNFTQFEDVINEAENELKKIKTNEAKTNISVTPKNKE
ncbi:tetratricopeptide repeat protein [Flavobacteriaceae bacterium S356]|uniref:Tetratricopeptide repeat protein n=1 Tax=Asprobacillus argus TaxID=3076534 RepID=A0ABU3LIG7_9FLAO|nr:tetratricopeptide repeat protein [Flavobacteriaceae bacterium S356]